MIIQNALNSNEEEPLDEPEGDVPFLDSIERAIGTHSVNVSYWEAGG